MNAFINIAYVEKSMKPFHVEMIKLYIKHTKEKLFAWISDELYAHE